MRGHVSTVSTHQCYAFDKQNSKYLISSKSHTTINAIMLQNQFDLVYLFTENRNSSIGQSKRMCRRSDRVWRVGKSGRIVSLLDHCGRDARENWIVRNSTGRWMVTGRFQHSPSSTDYILNYYVARIYKQLETGDEDVSKKTRFRKKKSEKKSWFRLPILLE